MSTRTFFVVGGLHFGGALCRLVSAQVPFEVSDVLEAPSPVFGNTFGNAPLVADLNSDGFDDIVCGEPYASVGGKSQAGRIWLLFGPSFRGMVPVSSADPIALELLGLERGSVGDVNGDGSLDLLAVAPDCPIAGLDRAGRAHLFLGPNFSAETILNDPTPVAGGRFGEGNLLHDVNGDALADVLMGAPGLGSQWSDPSPGEWWLWSATDLSLATALPNPFDGINGGQFGMRITAGDVDADGIEEVLVAMLGTISQAPYIDGASAIFDVPSFAVNQLVLAPPITNPFLENFGRVHYVGDMDGDAIPDLLVSSPQAGGPGLGTVGTLLVLRGPDYATIGKLLFSPDVGIGTFYFGGEACVADFDKDGTQDILVGDYGVGDTGNAVRLFYGPSFEVVQSFVDDPFVNNGFARWVAQGDFDADGLPDFCAGDLAGTGSVHVYDRKTLFANHTALSWATGGSIQFDVDIGQEYAASVYVGLLGVSGSQPGTLPAPGVFLPLNVDALTLLGLQLLGSPFLSNFLGVLDANGQGSFSLQLPGAVPVLAPGQTLVTTSIMVSPRSELQTGSSAVAVVLMP